MKLTVRSGLQGLRSRLERRVLRRVATSRPIEDEERVEDGAWRRGLPSTSGFREFGFEDPDPEHRRGRRPSTKA